MNEFSTFSAGVRDATADFGLSGRIIAGGPTESACYASFDYIVNEFRIRLACSDSYLAGYLSVVFAEK